jgi:spermidine synthase
VAGAAIFIYRRAGNFETHQNEKKVVAAAVLPPRTALALVTVTGAVSMGLEVLGSRAVALVVGGSLQAFAIVLMAFILGIGLGAAVIASRFFSKARSERTMFLLLILAATFIWVFIWRVEDWVIFYSSARNSLTQIHKGYATQQMLIALMAILALGFPAALLGAVLPIAIRGSAGENLSDQVGRLLTWNTLGAVVGVLFTGFVLMPSVGLRGGFLTLALALAVIGAIGAVRHGEKRLSIAGGAAAFAISLSLVWGGENWRHIFASGIFRIRNVQLTHGAIDRLRLEIPMKFYKDGPDASVAVEQLTEEGGARQFILRINGKADASSHGDLPTQYLLAHLPMSARPEAKDVFILGFGSGITGGAVLGHPVESLTVAENCGPVLEAAPLFGPWNRGVLTNARTRLRREDARTVLKLSDKQYDVIISEPSNPWVAGVGSVFTQEFYRLCASRLKNGGMMAQWFHIYEMHDGIVDLVLNTFASVFPNMEVWEPENGDIILLGSNQPWESSPAAFQKLFERPEVKRDFEAIGMSAAVQVLARQLASQRTAFAIPSGTAIQSDEFPVLEYAAPEAFFEARTAERVFMFDERTRQSALAPDVKRRTLRALPEQAIHSVFSEFSSANIDLLKYLKWRAGHVRDAATHAVYDLDPALPVIFRPPNSFAASSASTNRMEQLEIELARDPANATNALKEAETLLEQQPASGKSMALAGAAARAYLARGEIDRAKKIISRAAEKSPDDVEIGYFGRLIARMQK